MDADDYVESVWLEEIYKISRENKLDICISDFQMFSEKTGETLPHWWTLENQANNLIFHKVISPRKLKKWAIHGNVWSCMFNRQFIVKNELRFLNIKPADDASFLYSALIKAKRIYFHPVAYLHYRRGQGTSIVDLHGKNYESQKECLATIVKFIGEIGRGFFSSAKKKAFVWRFMHDVLYAAENIPRIAHWLADGGLADYLRIEVLRKKDIGKALLSRVRRLAKRFTTSLERPKAVEKLINDIEAARFGKKKDLYIVTGQLNSKTNEPIDSWTFFRYLQDNGIPSRYVIWRKHYLLKKIKKQGLMKDVIVLRGNGVKNFEFLNKCRKELVRARAVIQENGGIESFTGRWLRELPGCDYVFLQHGVFHLWLSNEVAEWLARSFNYINVASKRERDFLSSGFSLVPKESRADFLIGGLPRWDLLKDTSNKESEKIVFVMMTWRSTFNGGMDILKKSAYYRGLKSLLAKENLVEMKKMGLRVVWAPHHHMANRIKALDFEFDDLLEVVDTTEISKWIARSSICITDFSSVSGDFLFLGKPVVYWVPDRDDPLLDPIDGNSGAKVKSACENLEKWFNVAGSEVEVMEYIRHYKENGFKLEEEKIRIANTLFDCKDGICERLFNGLKNDYRNFS
jgi:CDP-glycerol glycerophosphotransferase (TagB/SpsB family)